MAYLRTKELSKIGYTNDVTRSLVMNIVSRSFKHVSKESIIALLINIKNKPEDFIHDEIVGKIASAFITTEQPCSYKTFDLLQETGRLKLYGGKEIEHSAKKQMETAMSLPITIQGALMPDAHTGYGLPIGGVLATRNAVVPYAVGVDIGCRMSLSILDAGESFLKSHSYQMKQALKYHTHFGMEGALEFKQEHGILDSAVFQATDFLKRLHTKAARQLGTSGSGNHFVEFG